MHGIGTQIDRLIIEEDVSVFLSLKYINSLNFFYLLFFINFQKKLINSSLLHGQRCTRVTMLGLNKLLRRTFKNKICQKMNLSLNYLFMEKKNLHYVWEKFKRTKKFCCFNYMFLTLSWEFSMETSAAFISRWRHLAEFFPFATSSASSSSKSRS